MGQVRDHLQRYRCGPGSHRFVDSGILMTPSAVNIGGTTMLSGGLRGLLECPACELVAFVGPDWCATCESPALHGEGKTLMAPGGGLIAEVPLCSVCYLEFLDARPLGWAVAAPNMPPPRAGD